MRSGPRDPLSTKRERRYFILMATGLMLLCIAGLLVYWEILLKALHAVSLRLARLYVDKVVSNMARMLLAMAKVYGGLKIHVDPNVVRESVNPSIVCSNHQSVADIAVLMAVLKNHKLRFVAKKELSRGFPAVSEVLQIQRHAFIDRSGGFRETIGALTKLAHQARAGLSPVVFPEGTRSKTGELKAFQEGAIRTLMGVNPMPVTAIAIDGGAQLYSVASLRRGLKDVTYRIRHVGTLPGSSDKTEIRQTLTSCRDLIAEQISEWHDR